MPSRVWSWSQRVVPSALCVLWPFAFFFNHVVAWKGRYALIGTELIPWHYTPKAFLLDQMRHGRIPLWSPSESAGFPFWSNPCSQAFYPLNVLALLSQELRAGYNKIDHQRFTVLACSILALGLYRWLRSLSHGRRSALTAALVLSVSFKMGALLRFTNAAHTAAWYPWILWGTTLVFAATDAKSLRRGALALFASLVFFVTAGYTYYYYYLLFLLPPYVLLLLAPSTFQGLTGRAPQRPWRSLVVFGTSAGAAMLLCSPYILKMYQFVAIADSRTGQGLGYAANQALTATDSATMLFFPPLSPTEGWLYLGMAGLALALLGVTFGDIPLRIKIALAVWFLAVTSLTHGPQSSLFVALWNALPGFDRLRVWSRLHVVAVPLLAYLVSVGYARFERLVVERSAQTDRKRIGAFLAVTLLLVGLAQAALLMRGGYHECWLEDFEDTRGADVAFIAATAFTFVALAVPLALARLPLARSWARWLIVPVLVISFWDMHRIGANMWPAHPYYRPVNERKIFDSDDWYMQSLSLTRDGTSIVMALGPRYAVAPLGQWHLGSYVRFWNRRGIDGPGPHRVLLGETEPGRFFFSEGVQHQTAASFLEDAKRFAVAPVVSHYDGDRLDVTVTAPVAGYFSFIDNWDPDWQAFVDGRERPISLLFGTFKSVALEAGPHQVSFAYRPRFGPFRLGSLTLPGFGRHTRKGP